MGKIFNVLEKLMKDKKDFKVGLFGTCNESTWREKLIPNLKMEYFNPVVKDWTPDCQTEELRQREICDYCLYVVTPKMTGVYSIAEVVQDSNKKPDRTLFCFLKKDDTHEFNESQIKSLDAVKKLVESNGSKVFDSLEDIIEYLNSKCKILI